MYFLLTIYLHVTYVGIILYLLVQYFFNLTREMAKQSYFVIYHVLVAREGVE